MKNITAENVRNIFVDIPHNPKGLGWKNNVHGCFQPKPIEKVFTFTRNEMYSLGLGIFIVVVIYIGFYWWALKRV